MTEPLAVGQFAIVDHEPVDRAPCVGVFRGRGPADDRPELYLLAEGTTPAGEQFAAHVVSAAGQAWASLDLSLTGSVKRLFGEAERNLREWNERSIAQHRVSLGLGAIVRRGRQVVLAQAGPSLAFHLKAGSVRIYAPEREHAAPIGGTEQPAVPQMRGLVVEPGDRLLLISTGALELADQDLIGAILGLPTEQALRDLYQRVRAARSVSVLLLSIPDLPGERVALLDGPPDDESPPGGDDEFIIGVDTPSPQREPQPYQPSLFIASGRPTASGPRPRAGDGAIPRDLPSVDQPRIEPLRRAVGDDLVSPVLGSSPDRPRLTLGPGAAAGPGTGLPPGGRPSLARRGPRDGESFSRGLVRRDDPAGRPEPAVEDAPPVDVLARQRRRQVGAAGAGSESLALEAGEIVPTTAPLVRMRTGPSGTRWKGSGSLGGGRVPTVSGWRPSSVMLAVALLVAVVIVAVFVLPSQFRESSDERYARLVADAGVALAESREEPDPALRRTALTEARAMLLEARELRSSDAEVLRLLEDVAAALSQMDAVRQPVAVETVASLSQFGEGPLAVTRMLAGETEVYLLDPVSGQVVGVGRDNGTPRVAFNEDAEAGRGRPVGIAAFSPDGSSTQVVVLDGRNNLWTIDPAGLPTRRGFAAPAGLQVTDLTASGSSLYVLDAAARAVYRFAYVEGGFTAAPETVLTDGLLERARYLLVGDSFVTVDTDGAIHRFEGAFSFELALAGIDATLSAAEPPQATGNPGEIAVLDPAQDRVVVLAQDGTFLRQYRHTGFAQASGLLVGPSGSWVYAAGDLRSVTWE